MHRSSPPPGRAPNRPRDEFSPAITTARKLLFSQRYTGRFAGPDGMDANGEYSNDEGANWQHDFTMSFTRVE